MVFSRKNKDEVKAEQDAQRQKELDEVEQEMFNKVIEETTKTETEHLTNVKSEVEHKTGSSDDSSEVLSKVEELLQSIKKPKSIKTIVKVTAFEQKDDVLYFGFSSEKFSKEQIDAIISLLNKELVIEHEKRNLINISMLK
jgi:hypothetical protein